MNFPKTELDNRVVSDGIIHIKESKDIDKKKQTKHSNQFVKVAFNNINDRDWRIRHRSSLTGYLYIASKVYRKITPADTYDLYHRFYMDNKVAAMVPVRDLAEAFGYGSNTKPVRGWIKTLKEEGAFIIEQIEVGKPKPANVYVIGEFRAKKEFLYYGNLKGV
jgi:hypothetical protein